VTRVLALVEGETERLFVERVLAPHLLNRGVYLGKPVVVWTKRSAAGGGFRGGGRSYSKIRDSLEPLLKDSTAYVTTIFDFYGLPDDFPGRAGAEKWSIETAESAFAGQFSHPHFIPFLALHEIEAWLFAAPDEVAAHFSKPDMAARMRNMGAPEEINHGPDTHPKARVKNLEPGYGEIRDGATLLQKIGLEPIRAACPHFRAWLEKLEGLASA